MDRTCKTYHEFAEIKEKIMDKNLQAIKDFVEGKLDINEMLKLCKTDKYFRDYIKDFKHNELAKYKNSFLYFIDNTNFKIPTKQLTLFLVFVRELAIRQIPYQRTDLYIDKSQKYCEIIPEWLPDSASDWVEENLLNKVPEGLSDAQKKKWIKAEVEKRYPCEKRHPSWVQGTEDWPQDEDGNNLTFVKQREKGEQVTYTFVNPKTKENVDVIEFY